MYSVGVLSRFSRCVTHRRFLETITPLLEEVWNASAGIHIRVECVEYVAGIRDIASIARDDAAGKKRNSSRAHNRWGELETSFFVLSSQFRPRRLVLGRQIVETIPILLLLFVHDSRESMEPVPFCVSPFRAWKLATDECFLKTVLSRN